MKDSKESELEGQISDVMKVDLSAATFSPYYIRTYVCTYVCMCDPNVKVFNVGHRLMTRIVNAVDYVSNTTLERDFLCLESQLSACFT